VPAVICYLRDRCRLADRLVGGLESATIPMALVCSAEDALSGGPTMAEWRRRFPEAPLFELPAGVGHYAPLECPGAVLQFYASFRDTLPR